MVALFMEDLGMSYREVVDEVPYMLLMAMRADKPHLITGDLVERTVVSGKELMRRKKRQ